jgi:hypothetical protein
MSGFVFGFYKFVRFLISGDWYLGVSVTGGGGWLRY